MMYSWPPVDQFLNRSDDLAALETWWSSPTRDAVGLVGRRRVGKSWLFRRFAHGRPAVVLVADTRLLTTQMGRFATELEPHFGFRPDITDVPALVRSLYQLGQNQKLLAVIDEFPFLIPDGKAGEAVLSEIQAVMEDHRDASQTKLVLCGSLIGQMESLLHAGSPLHGRVQQLDIWPMTFAEGRALVDRGDTADQRIVRHAVAGGMARYLAELGHGPIKQLVCEKVLDRRGALFNDPRVVLEQELRNPATYFSILEELSAQPAMTEHLTNKFSVGSSALSPYLTTLRQMRLISSSLPVGAPAKARSHKHRVSDGFIRFWFQFVFPHQEGLQSGLRPRDLWDATIEPMLSDFVASTYEELCTRYTRITRGAAAPNVGSWWGPALNKHRRAKERMTEEIDVVGAHHRNLRIVGECKWTSAKMPKSVLDDLRTYKIPAIAEEKNLKVPAGGPEILLFCRSGFEPALEAAADADDKIDLITLDDLTSALDTEIT